MSILIREVSTLLLGIVVIFVAEWVIAYDHYSRDWCGFAMVKPILKEVWPQMTVMAVIYFDGISAITGLFPQESIRMAIFSLLGLGLDLLKPLIDHLIDKVFRKPPKPPKRHYHAAIFETIVKKKTYIAETILADPNCLVILEEAIGSSDLRRSRKTELRKIVDDHPTRSSVYEVVNEVGVNVMKTFVADKRGR